MGGRKSWQQDQEIAEPADVQEAHAQDAPVLGHSRQT